MKRSVFIFIIILMFNIALSGCLSNNSSNKPAIDIDKEGPITISVFMTFKDIILKLGDNYTLKTEIKKTTNEYYSSLMYKDISFDFYHVEQNCPDEAVPCNIVTTSNNYTFSNGFYVGESALSALKICDILYTKVYDKQNEMWFFDIFNYKEKKDDEFVDTVYKIRFEYTNDKYYKTRSEVPQEATIELIHIFSTSPQG